MLQPIDYYPTGGINQEDPEVALQPTEVRTSQNFLFERKMATMRPGLKAYALALGQRIQYGKSFDFGGSIQTLVMGTSGLWSLTAFTPTALTGPALTLGTPDQLAAESVNGLILASGNGGGLIRWDPTGTAYTVIAAAPYRYVTSHLSRAIAAYKMGNGNALLDSRTVAYSTAGDETNWTGFGSNSVVLADSPGVITGICNIRDVVVVAKTDGFHLGTATGVSNPAYDWRLHSKNSTWGCKYPTTLAASQDACYYAGKNDVYMFNLVGNPESIGRGIRRELLGYLRLGYLYRGFVSDSYGANSRAHYHLVPQVFGQAPLPHYSYDIEEKTWARHTYGFATYGGWYMRLINNTSAPVLVVDDTSGNLRVWDDTVACEQQGILKGRRIPYQSPAMDYNFKRVQLLYKSAFGDVTGTTVVCQTRAVADPFEGSTDTEILPSAEGWSRQWFDVQVVGQLPFVDVTVPANNSISIAYIGIGEVSEAGEARKQ